MMGARQTIAVDITFRKFDNNSVSAGPTLFGQAGKETSCTTAATTVRLLLVSPKVSRKCWPMTQCTMTVYYDTPARNDSRLLEHSLQ